MTKRDLTTLVLLVVLVGCAPPVADQGSGSSSAAPEAIAAAPQDWPTGDPLRAGFRAAALEQLSVEIEDGAFPNTHALLVEHDGALVYERYFSGTDERWGGPLGELSFGPDSLHDLRSISKSVTSALLGLALQSDFATAVARPVTDYLNSIEVDEERQAITLHHMLTMTPGLEWNEMDVPYTDSANDEIRLYSAVDPARYVLERTLIHAPGTTWYYTGGSTQVLASIIHDLTGQRLDEYARVALFEPLGITDFEWLGPGSWTPDAPAAMSGLRLRARDLAKFGSLYLNGGRWQGKQVIPELWVEMSITRHVPEIGAWSAGGTRGYGYQWWVGEQPTGESWAAGFGNGNQRVYVFPDEALAITIFAGQYNRGGSSEALIARVLELRDQRIN